MLTGVLGMVGHSFLIYGAVKKSAKKLIPALLLIPISYVTGIINIILHSPTTVDIIITTFILTRSAHHLIMTTVIMTAVAILTMIVTYSFRHELQENTETDK